ncbi:tripartite tricarboxylate transporter TctB family protein [Frigidibacter mobilis]|nr:tripartite tricarboxylate transporter TctB family protein [Frigidibacter mobilis]
MKADLPGKFRSRDTVAGLGVAAIGSVFALGALRFGTGSLTEMGAGYFPFATGVITMLLGLAVFLGDLLKPSAPIPRPAVRAFLFVAASVVVFALTIDRLGLLPAVILCGTISALADPGTKLHEAVLLATALAGGIWLVFVQLLGMPIMAVMGV